MPIELKQPSTVKLRMYKLIIIFMVLIQLTFKLEDYFILLSLYVDSTWIAKLFNNV